MHILTASTPIDLGAAGPVKPGRYIVEDVNGAEMLVMAERGTAKLEPFEIKQFNWRTTLPGPAWAGSCFRDFNPETDYNGKTILFMRSGGFGDMAFLGVILREVRRRWPNASLSVACRKERAEVLDGLGLINGHFPTPVSVELAASFDAVVSFENVVESTKSLHYVEAMAAHMGLELPAGDESKRIEYQLTAVEKLWGPLGYPRKKGIRRMGIQVKSGSRYRSYPLPALGSVALHFINKGGWEVFLFGAASDAPNTHKHPMLKNLTLENYTFRRSVAVMATCDLVLGPDSALVHVAGALGIPTVALFGSIDSALRTKYAPSITAIDGEGSCAKCNFHERGGIQFPRGMPCEKSGRCEVLAGISVESIVAAIEARVNL